jgi:UDP-N-acetylglucosamine 3-dehydrogenase
VTKPVGVGVIGVGVFGEQHARVYSETPRTKLIAVSDINAERAEEVARKYGAEAWYSDYNELLKRKDIEAVSIATSDHLHLEPSVAAAEAGKDILLEKPIASTIKDAETIVKTVDKAHVKLMIGYILRFEIHYAGIKNAIESGIIGEPLSVYSRMNCMLAEARYIKGRVTPTLYMAVHDFDQMLWYFKDEPRTVHAEAVKGNISRELNVPDGVWTLVKFARGGVGCDESLWCLPDKFGGQDWSVPRDWRKTLSDLKMEVVGTDGALWLDYPPNILRGCDKEGWKFPQMVFRPVIHGKLGGALREELAHFIECVAEDKKPLGAQGTDAILSLKMAIAADKSVATGKTIEVSSIHD